MFPWIDAEDGDFGGEVEERVILAVDVEVVE
jgi:hypothetical protein